MTDDARRVDAINRAATNGQLAAVSASDGLDRFDRRRNPRIAWEHHDVDDVELEVQQPGEDWRPVDCTLVDLGPGGMGVLAAEPLAPGARVRVTLQLPGRVGREPDPDEEALLTLAQWIGQGEVVHARHTPERIHPHVPEDAHRPHHHGVRFQSLEGEAEHQLMNALYGPLPVGWAVERYATSGKTSGAAAERYAVLKDGQRVARGFTSYDRARSRAWSMHMDEAALARRQRSPLPSREGG
jgi:hypothetical protein